MKREKSYVKAIFKEEAGEFCCSKCGLVLREEQYALIRPSTRTTFTISAA
ncbi:hypothetical protein KEJ33_04110 [Candidatus Bathyarchaeota archaeon]|nr:hypothetical protein [Candidatus Bathyarchaeota archaeon]